MWRLPAFSWPSATVPWSPCASSHALVCGEAQAVDEHKAHDSSCSSFQYITVKILHNSINAYIEGGKKGRKTILKSYSEHLTTTTIVNIIIFISNNNKQQYIYTSGGPLSALTCCVNVRLLSAIKKISPLIYSQSWVGSWVYTTHYDDFHPDILARMYT